MLKAFQRGVRLTVALVRCCGLYRLKDEASAPGNGLSCGGDREDDRARRLMVVNSIRFLRVGADHYGRLRSHLH